MNIPAQDDAHNAVIDVQDPQKPEAVDISCKIDRIDWDHEQRLMRVGVTWKNCGNDELLFMHDELTARILFFTSSDQEKVTYPRSIFFEDEVDSDQIVRLRPGVSMSQAAEYKYSIRDGASGKHEVVLTGRTRGETVVLECGREHHVYQVADTMCHGRNITIRRPTHFGKDVSESIPGAVFAAHYGRWVPMTSGQRFPFVVPEVNEFPVSAVEVEDTNKRSEVESFKILPD